MTHHKALISINSSCIVQPSEGISQAYIVKNNFCNNHENYNSLDCDWFKKILFSTNSHAKLLANSFYLTVCYRTVQWANHIQSYGLNQHSINIKQFTPLLSSLLMQIFPFSQNLAILFFFWKLYLSLINWLRLCVIQFSLWSYLW